jgi:molecular chaperone Hsp33
LKLSSANRMSELHKFLFEDLPVRGMVVRLDAAWKEILQRRATNSETGADPQPVRALLGEMTAASVLMQASIQFKGALVMQIFGDGPLKVAVTEVQSDLRFRTTAKVVGPIAHGASLSAMVNVNNEGRCAITLDPKDKMPGQQPYQSLVPLYGDQHEKLEQLSSVLEHFMLQSQQIDTTLVLAANDECAAGLLIQRMPLKGEGNLAGTATQHHEDETGLNEDYNRIAILARSLTAQELLTLDPEDVMHRLFWEEKVLCYPALTGAEGPRFECSCSRERVGRMLLNLGQDEAQAIVAERHTIEVGCDFCGMQYVFDAVDTAQVFTAVATQVPAPTAVQ